MRHRFPARARPALRLLFVLCACGALAAGCGSDATGPDDETARIEGRVLGGTAYGDDGAAGVEGAVVTAQRYLEDGRIQVVSRESDVTNGAGDFTLDTDLNGERFVVIVATKGQAQWRAVVSSELRFGEIVHAPPLNDESTLEAWIYDRLAQNGSAPETSHAETQVLVTRNVTAVAAGLPSLRTHFAAGMEAFGETENLVLTRSPIGASQTALDAVRVRKADAAARFEQVLAASADSASVDAAFASFEGSLAQAYASEGLALADHAKALLAAMGALVYEVVSEDARATLPVYEATARRRVPAVDAAVQALFEELNADAELTASVAAMGALLDEDVRAARTPEALEAAFGLYHVRILDRLKQAYPQHVLLLDAMDLHVVYGGPLWDLWDEVNAAASALEVGGAYMDYYDVVRAFITNANTDLTGAELSAIADLLIILSLDISGGQV